MRLRNKISIIIIVTWAIMFGAVYVGSHFILQQSFIQLENQQATENTNRALQAIEQMIDGVALIASSNAVWNDAYQFVADRNDAFIKANLQLGSLVGFGTDMLLFFNAKGLPVYYAVTNPDRSALISLPANFITYLQPKSKLVDLPQPGDHAEGLVPVADSILLAASHAIVKADNSGPVHGALIAVKYLTPALMQKLRDVTKLNLQIYRMYQVDNDNFLLEVKALLLHGTNAVLDKRSDVIYSYTFLRDINNNPFAILKVTMPRGIFKIGQHTIDYFSAAFLTAGIIFVILLLYLFRNLIANRLEKLNRQLIAIGKTKEFTKRIVEEGDDELTSVEIEINKMLNLIQDSVLLSKKLSQSEKMASIGVLTAGVAHEINNPINFVMANIDPLQEDFADVLSILNKYLSINSAAEYREKLPEILKQQQEIDLAYVLDEIDRLLKSIKEGASRTAKIINDLKLFSRIDENAMKKTDINTSLDSTLSLLYHHYKSRITVSKDFGNIPLVDCLPGKINQVFMNILSNAIDAIEGQGEIFISTRQIGQQVEIKIKDSGKGIESQNLTKIFEPFYTTKEVGKGTGLGLAISFGIMRDHHGSLEVRSLPGEGALFIITLPIDHV